MHSNGHTMCLESLTDRSASTLPGIFRLHLPWPAGR